MARAGLMAQFVAMTPVRSSVSSSASSARPPAWSHCHVERAVATLHRGCSLFRSAWTARRPRVSCSETTSRACTAARKACLDALCGKRPGLHQPPRRTLHRTATELDACSSTAGYGKAALPSVPKLVAQCAAREGLNCSTLWSSWAMVGAVLASSCRTRMYGTNCREWGSLYR